MKRISRFGLAGENQQYRYQTMFSIRNKRQPHPASAKATHRTRRRGLGLIETVFAIFCIALAGLGFAGLAASGAAARRTAQEHSYALHACQEAMETTRAMPFDTMAGSYTSLPALQDGRVSVTVTPMSITLKKVDVLVTWRGYASYSRERLTTYVEGH